MISVAMDYSHSNTAAGRSTMPSKTKNSVSSTALLAVALQDHWMKNMSPNADAVLGRKKLPSLQSRLRTKRTPAKAVVDTGRKVPSAKKETKKTEQEFVLDAKPAPLSLAQKLGLVDAPASQLSEGDWAVVKAKSNARHDSQFPCVICKEDFGTQQQVLLSCTHVFHRACLEAFERFSGKKCCPMCRKEQYQKRVIHEGAKQHRHICATRIQATWRGYVVRSWYKKLRGTVPPKDPLLKKKFYHEKLTSITDRMVRSLDFDVNGFIQELDDNLKQSREIFKHFDSFLKPISEEEWTAIQLKATERGETECPICLTKLEDHGWAVKDEQSKNATSVSCHTSPKRGATQNNSLKDGVSAKNSPNHNAAKTNSVFTSDKTSASSKCSNRPNSLPKAKTEIEKRQHKPLVAKKSLQRAQVLLSCSHVFHNTCLLAFEEFAVGERRHVCPVCRNHYHKRVIGGDNGESGDVSGDVSP